MAPVKAAASRALGFRIGELAPGRAVPRVRFARRLTSAYGIHGGVVLALADAAGGLAAFSVVRPGRRVATVELTLNSVAPQARAGWRPRPACSTGGAPRW